MRGDNPAGSQGRIIAALSMSHVTVKEVSAEAILGIERYRIFSRRTRYYS
jgi:hypothetical protein